MNSLQISQILSSNLYTKSKFLGCVPCDLIPSPSHFPFFVIVNTDESRKPGKHWCLIYAENSENAEYFDSFGKKPKAQIRKYLERFKKVFYSTQCIQEKWSEACGLFCILYAIQRSRGGTPKQIVSSLKKLNPLVIENFLF